MKRSDFLKKMGRGVVTLPFSTLVKRGSKNRDQPNVLFIALDDMNDWIGCMGGKSGIHTPNIDRLARQGTLFTRAYCSAPSCTPSRTSILTGKRPSTTGVYGLIRHHWRQNKYLKNNVTLPQHFRNNGYRAIGGGKIFHALSWISDSYGTNQNEERSWDSYYPSIEQSLPEFQWPAEIQRSSTQIQWSPVAGGGDSDRVPPYYFDWGPLEEDETKTSDYKVAAWGAKELQESGEQPFFLAAGIFRPHIPWFVPQKYFDMYPLMDIKVPLSPADDLDDLPPTGRQIGSRTREWHKWLIEQGLWKQAVQGYMASSSYADAQVGRLLDGLAASPYADNTIVVLWSDHGFHLGEKQTWEKFTLWEESGRVPLIIKAPGVTSAGSRCGEPVSLLDLYPTLVDLCGLPRQEAVEGQSLRPLLEQPNRDMGRAIVTTFGYQNHSIRSRRWRYIRFKDGSEELYDHDHDSGEFYNIASDSKYNSVKKRLAENLPKVNRRGYEPNDSN